MREPVDSNRIAKNTIFLYIRMFIILIAGLYTSRIVLQRLGVEDFGLYSVVGGVIVVLTFLNNTIAGTTQRFLNFEIGTKNSEKLVTVFGNSVIIHIGIAFIVFLLSQTIGLWFLNKIINIPHEKIVAANCVYQFSILSITWNIVTTPFHAAIISHEKMSIYAYVSMLEAALKLGSATVLFFFESNLLILYALLMFISSSIPGIIYILYAKHSFFECRNFSLKIDKVFFKKMLSFSGWTIFGNLSYLLHTQGIAFAINIFFSVAVNAAQGIANQVNTCVNLFIDNFMQALKPQIVKTYANNDFESMYKLMFRGCKISIFLASLLIIPLIIECPFILKIWLEDVPTYTSDFTRLVLIISLVNSISSIFATAQGATGNIRAYQITLTLIGALHLPFSILFFMCGFTPYYAMYVYLVISLILQVFRISFLTYSIKFPALFFSKTVLLRMGTMLIITFALGYIVHKQFSTTFLSLLSVCFTTSVSLTVLMLVVGFDKIERKIILSVFYNKFKPNTN